LGPAAIPLGPFDLTHLIGKGGMGLVWQGTHRASGTKVAVKTLRRESRDAESIAQFEHEVRAVAAMEHPGIVRVFDYGLIDEIAEAAAGDRLAAGCPYLAMELCAGGTARQLVGRATWPEIRNLVLAVLDTLAHAHARRVIHRDLKPGNILLPGPKLTDFGIAQVVARDRRVADGSPDNFYGSPSFVAPEQIQVRLNEIGPWTDLYSLGCVVWKLTTGTAPYVAKSAIDVLQGHLKGTLPPYRPEIEVPVGFEDWLLKCLQVRPGARFQHAGDAARALKSLEEGGTIDVPRLPTPSDWRATEARTVPARLAGAGLGLFGLRRLPLSGRFDERDRLWAQLRIVTDRGVTRALVLRGAAGTGKSTLAEWLCDRTEEFGIGRTGKAGHGEQPSKHDGVAPMLGRMLRAAGLPNQTVRWFAEQRLRALGRTTPRLWHAIADFVTPPMGPGLGEGEGRAVTAAYLSAEAGEQPLVLWFDDVQWGAETLRLVGDLLQRSRVQPRPILMLLTVRDEAVDPDSEAGALLHALEQLPPVTTTTLEPLDAEGSRLLVHDLLGLEPELAEKVVARAEGNPLFATQLVADWVARGVLEPDYARGGFVLPAGTEAAIPDGVHDLWRSRTDRATGGDDQIRGAMEVAAALGLHVTTAEWLLCCDRAGLAVPFGLTEGLARDGLVRFDDDGWSFAHGLLRESLERDAREAGRWSRYNTAIAAQLVGGSDPRSKARRAAALAETADLAQATTALLRSARDLREQGDLREADVLVDRAEARLASHPEPDPLLQTAVGIERCALRRRQGLLDGLEDHLDDLLAFAQANDWPLLSGRALRELAALAMGRGAPEIARRRLDEALREAEADDDRDGIAEATRSLADALLALRQTSAAEETYRRAAAMFEALPDPIRQTDCLLQFAALMEERGEAARARAARQMALDGLRRAAEADWPGARARFAELTEPGQAPGSGPEPPG